jgi:primosomal protein N' (replication factor Y) (superfamily II helicase)
MAINICQDVSSPVDGRNTVAAVAFPITLHGLYDYRIPAQLYDKVMPGTPVLVDLKNRRLWGVAVALKPSSEFTSLKEIIAARSEHWTDRSRSLIRLYRWMAAYYQCDLGRVFRPLVGRGIAAKREKQVTIYRASPGGNAKLSAMQQEAFNALQSLDAALTKKEIGERLGIADHLVTALCKKEYLVREQKTVVREAFEMGVATKPERVTLTDEQMRAVDAVAAKFDAPDRPFLLHGITGSGKTHVYTELAGRALRQGRSVIVLVPEISLTPQTISRFRAAVGDCVTVIHSHMSDGERRDSLQTLVTGSKRLVIGVRSAVLAPMDDVGLIVVDEEHDASYKQTDTDPRYNARDVAIMRGNFQNAAVLLGSATPSLESAYNARSGKYHLLTLTARFGEASLPAVRIVDMNEEHQQNNWTILSRPLEEGMRAALAAGRQIILLLNRRGYAVILICKDCGYSHRCPACSVSLRYHRSDCRLKCHLCGHEAPAPDRCPVCHGDQMKYQGTGIQKAEELIALKFPGVRILRMDRDTTRRKGAHHSILDTFAERQADILLGTQMVSKGLNFPGVALVGVLQADTGLLFPDFRASERTFQLLTQVAGRAGRSDSAGEVVIQTYYPHDPSIMAAGRHDYEAFYTAELPHRKELRYPPFAKLARIVLAGPQDHVVRTEMGKIARDIGKLSRDIVVLGPSPAVLEKINNEFRYSLLLKSVSPKTLADTLAKVRAQEKSLPKKMRLIIDVDPVYML